MSNDAERRPPIRVLGIGSPFGLDSIGWRLVEALSASAVLHPYLNQELLLETLDRPGVNLRAYFENASYVLLLDAVLDDEVPVGLARRYLINEIGRADLLQSSHGFGVQQVISLASALGQLPEKLELLGVSIAAGRQNHQNDNIDWKGTTSALAASLEQELIRHCDAYRDQNVTN